MEPKPGVCPQTWKVATKVNVSQIIFRLRAFISCIIANQPPRITITPTSFYPIFPKHSLWLYRSKYRGLKYNNVQFHPEVHTLNNPDSMILVLRALSQHSRPLGTCGLHIFSTVYNLQGFSTRSNSIVPHCSSLLTFSTGKIV